MPGDYAAPCWLLRQARQLLYPRRCPFCRRVLGFVPTCPECAERLEPLRRMPMRLKESEHYLGTLSGAAAPYRYTGCVRSAVLRAKYQGEPWTAVELGVEMARLLFGSEILMRGAEPTPQRVEGLSLGYDAIVPVPASSKKRGYNVPERMARPLAKAVGVPLAANALARTRTGRHQAGLSLDERLVNVAGAFRVLEPDNVDGKRVLLVDGEPVKLTATKLKIVDLLMRNLGRVFPAEEIYRRVWNEEAYATENTVMVHIRRIREKIELNPKEPEYLKVVWGIGYKIEKR